MYTVAELIETLKQCPQDYKINILDIEGFALEINSIGITHDEKTVDFFMY